MAVAIAETIDGSGNAGTLNGVQRMRSRRAAVGELPAYPGLRPCEQPRGRPKALPSPAWIGRARRTHKNQKRLPNQWFVLRNGKRSKTPGEGDFLLAAARLGLIQAGCGSAA